MFEYHIKLHYSQTIDAFLHGLTAFEYHIKLHYSQTESELGVKMR